MAHTLTNGDEPMAGERLVVVTINGIPAVLDRRTGRTFPRVAGGSDEPPGEGSGSDGDDAGESAEDEDSSDKERQTKRIQALRAAEKRLQATVKAREKELDETRAKLKQHDDEKLTEAERLKARLEELEKATAEHEQERRTWRDERALDEAARKHNARNPSVVVRLIDRAKLERNDAGDPTNAEDLVKTILKDEPYLVGGSATAGVPGTPRSNSSGKTDADREAALRNEMKESGRYAPL